MNNNYRYSHVWGNDGELHKYGYKVIPLFKFLPKTLINRIGAGQADRANYEVNGIEKEGGRWII